MRKLFQFGVLATAVLFAAAVAFADPIPVTGIVYQGTPNAGNAGDPANMASNLAQASFTVGPGGIDFESGPSAYQTGAFLNNPTFTGAVNGFNPNGTLNNNEIVLTGQLFLNAGNNSFVVGHDDGVVLNITGFGTVVNQPNGTTFTNTPFNVNNGGAAGLYSFTLDYAECCGAPADLLFAINNNTIGSDVPEPNTSVLLGTGLLLGLFGLAWKKRFVFDA